LRTCWSNSLIGDTLGSAAISICPLGSTIYVDYEKTKN
jgi:hypothetical protein